MGLGRWSRSTPFFCALIGSVRPRLCCHHKPYCKKQNLMSVAAYNDHQRYHQASRRSLCCNRAPGSLLGRLVVPETQARPQKEASAMTVVTNETMARPLVRSRVWYLCHMDKPMESQGLFSCELVSNISPGCGMSIAEIAGEVARSAKH